MLRALNIRLDWNSPLKNRYADFASQVAEPPGADMQDVEERDEGDERVIDEVLDAFGASIPEWRTVIEASFLPERLRQEYMDVVGDRASRLGFDMP